MAGWVQDGPTGADATNSGLFTTAAFGNPTTFGNTIVGTIGDDSSANNNVAGISDSHGNSWKQVASLGAFDSGSMWYAPLTGAGSNHTITIRYKTTFTTGINFVFQEFSGIVAFGLDVAASSDNVANVSIASGTTATTTQANEVVVMGGQADASTITFTLGSGYTNLIQVASATPNMAVTQQSKVVAVIGTQSGVITQSSAGTHDTVGVIGAFKIGNFFVGDTGANYSSPRHVIVADGMSRSEVAN